MWYIPSCIGITRANQLNRNNPLHTDNHSQQNNPNNGAYWRARGYTERPSDWRERAKREG